MEVAIFNSKKTGHPRAPECDFASQIETGDQWLRNRTSVLFSRVWPSHSIVFRVHQDSKTRNKVPLQSKFQKYCTRVAVINTSQA